MNKSSDSTDVLKQLRKLANLGCLGWHTHFEATEVVGIRDGAETVHNVFTLIVLEERGEEEVLALKFLNSKPIRLKSLEGWRFGIARYTRLVADFLPALEHFDQTGEWRASGTALTCGKLEPMPPVFAGPDTAKPLPLNHVLKNNFWNGSHVFEWADPDKAVLRPFLDQPPRLHELSEAVQEFVPLRLASLSDRLGSLVVQIPVTILMSHFGSLQNGNDFALQIAWHPRAAPRLLRASINVEYDEIVTGYRSAEVKAGQTILPLSAKRGLHRGFIWDEQEDTLLATTGASAFISTIVMNMHVMAPEPRVFRERQPDGTLADCRVGVINVIQNRVGPKREAAETDWTQKRIYTEERLRLARERRFVQYKPVFGEEENEHANALKDIRSLINAYGSDGAWLWDPYLSAEDIIKTLFHCCFHGVDLRALTAGDEAPDFTKTTDSYEQRQRLVFEGSQSNLLGLRLEYRVRKGMAGWPFHDRFLIFPKIEGGALAWSLGTSVNALGMRHHILQRVDDGQLVVDAFGELWDQLGGPEYLIWKNP